MNVYESYVKSQFYLHYYYANDFYFNAQGVSNFLPVNLKFSYCNNSMEITPDVFCLLLTYIKQNKYIINQSEINDECDIYIPLCSNNKADPTVAKTTTKMFNNRLENARLITFKLKDSIYYYGNNILLDSDFNVLFLITYKTKIALYKDSPYHNIEITDIILRINPSIWESDNTISKAIKSKLFNYWISNDISFVNTGGNYSIFSNPKINKKLYIEDPSNFITSVKIPDYSFSNANMNKYLLDNIDLL